ncbi:MAG: hypothetical protein HY769_01505, partial [Candidatus Stahlbacteria bacterium]|nr:hypothetical protein [Candidatus Stahlbacteria bacterium]
MGESIFFIILNVISGEQIYDQMISAFYEATTLSYKSEGITYYEGRKDTEMFSYEAMLKKPDYAKIISKYGFIVSNSENTYISIYG